MRTVAVLAIDGVLVFDLATPIEIFGRVRTAANRPAYRVLVAGPRRTVAAGPVTMSVPGGLDDLVSADTVIVPGRSNPTDVPEPKVLNALRAAAARGARIASICSGALDLAATGLLDGLRATTHWQVAEVLASTYPEVEVTATALFVDNGQILCSAGAAAGIDLCLHMVAADLGGAVAADAARNAVMPLTRDANQAQFIRDDTVGSTSLHDVLTWIEAHAERPLRLTDIAETAGVSTRTLNRRFADELGVTPTAWLARARVRRAQCLLETTDLPVERIADKTGLGTAANLRSHFAKILHTSPTRYRTALRVDRRIA